MNEYEGKSQKNQSSYAMETGQQKLKCKSSTKNVKEGLEISHLAIESTTPLPEDSHMAEKKTDVTPVPRNLMTFSGLHKHRACT